MDIDLVQFAVDIDERADRGRGSTRWSLVSRTFRPGRTKLRHLRRNGTGGNANMAAGRLQASREVPLRRCGPTESSPGPAGRVVPRQGRRCPDC